MNSIIGWLAFSLSLAAFFFSFDKLKISLFTLRFEVYQEIRQVLESYSANDYMGITPKIFEFEFELEAKAKFLFGDDKEINDLIKFCFDLIKGYEDPKKIEQGDPEVLKRMEERLQRGKITEDHNKFQKEIKRILDNIDKIFSRHLFITLNPLKSAIFYIMRYAPCLVRK